MIIDFHSHLAFNEIYSREFILGMVNGEIQNIQADKIWNLLSSMLNDVDGQKLIHQMDQAQVDKSVLLIIDGEFGFENPPKHSIEEIHKFHYNILKANKERFIVLAGIDPRRDKKGLDLFKKSIEKYGFKGLKLYPPMGFSIQDYRLTQYYQLCAKHKIPVLIHTGDSLSNLKNEFADPMLIEPVLIDHPDVNFVLAHAGNFLTKKLEVLILKYPNVYLDISGFQSFLKNNNYTVSIERIFQKGLDSKILFGSDWPLFNLMRPLKKSVSDFIEVVNCCKGFDRNCIENIMFKNASKLMNL